MEYCDQHMKFNETLAVISNNITHIMTILEADRLAVKAHLDESTPIREIVHQTAYKVGQLESDKLIRLEKELEKVKVGYILSGVIGGCIGGLFSQLTPEVFTWIVGIFK